MIVPQLELILGGQRDLTSLKLSSNPTTLTFAPTPRSLDLLWIGTHSTHFCWDDSVAAAKRIGAAQTFFVGERTAEHRPPHSCPHRSDRCKALAKAQITPDSPYLVDPAASPLPRRRDAPRH